MNDAPPNTTADVRQFLVKTRESVAKLKPGWRIATVALLVLAVGLGALWYTKRSNTNGLYKTAEVTRGDLTVIVTATGTLQPVNQVDVGSELSGTIRTVEVDVNDIVKKGQVLARLDTDRLKSRVVESSAALDSARAKLEEAKATLAENRNKYERLKTLAEKQLYSQQDIETARATYERSVAAVSSAEAQMKSAQATLASNRTDLSKAVIESPINGIVLTRNIEPGQTVAASFQTPVLFTLAEDLKQMELHVDVDEADVGQVQAEQKSSFTVDAYPERRFQAKIIKVNYAPKVVQDVVTYEALLSVDNSDLVLRPGMTATAEIVTRVIEDALLVPNGALRFTPPAPQTKTKSSGVRRLLPGPPRRNADQKPADTTKRGAHEQKIWTLRDNQPLAVMVQTGATDGRMTEIKAGDIEPGMLVLVDIIKPKK